MVKARNELKSNSFHWLLANKKNDKLLLMSQVSWIDVERLFSFVIWLHVSHVNNTNDQFPNLRTQKLKYLWKEKKLFENGKHHTSWFWNVFQISSIYFLLHGHLKGKSYENAQLRLLLSILLEEHLTSNFIVCISRYKSFQSLGKVWGTFIESSMHLVWCISGLYWSLFPRAHLL